MKSRNESDLDVYKLIWISVGIILASFTHWQRLPVWIPVVHISLISFRLYIPYQFPNIWINQYSLLKFIRLGGMFAGITGVYLSYGTLTGRDVGIALLVVLAGLKIFECNNKRDLYISTYLGYFLVITNFFYTQTIPTALYMLLVIIIMTVGLINFNDTEQKLSLSEHLKFSTILIIQSVPVLIVLFVLFPRVNGPLWGLPQDAYTGITGIDDQMSPGTISKLVQSREVAFRVSFETDIPEQSKLYWRGPVLWKTDGRKWTTGNNKINNPPAPVEFYNQITRYEITLEPTNKKWLFGLEMITDDQLPEKSYLTNDRQLKAKESIRSRKAFKLASYSNYFHGINNNNDLEYGLQLPENSHIKTKQFGVDLQKRLSEPELIIKEALDWFRNESFTYTLTPPLITGDAIDEFLFETRQGFCEHYAAAFTILMRAAGIPARVVTGYLGGEINPLGNYLIVRQYHAHAWSEVWIESRGWTRIDPTSVILPARVNEGIETAIPQTLIDVPLNIDNYSFALKLWQRLGNTIDMVNYQWAQWILGYGPERQQIFLKKIGLDSMDWKKMTFTLMMITGLIIFFIGLYIFTRDTKEIDPAKLFYKLFCNRLSKIGLDKYGYEGPLDFSNRISNIRQDLKNDIQYITELYIAVRYRSENNKLLQLKEHVQSFIPKQL